MADVEIGERRFFLVALLAFHNQGVHVIRRPANFLRKTVFLVLRKVVQVDIHQLRKADELLIQLRLVVESHLSALAIAQATRNRPRDRTRCCTRPTGQC